MAKGYLKVPKEATCVHCAKPYMKELSAQRACAACQADPEVRRTQGRERMQRWTEKNPERRRAQTRKDLKKFMKQRTDQRAALREQLKAARFRELHGHSELDSYHTAVNGPVEKWDGKVHIKNLDVVYVFLCGRSHRLRARWMKPAPNRNVNCKKCAAAWEKLFPGVPVPIAGSDDWDDEERKRWGF